MTDPNNAAQLQDAALTRGKRGISLSVPSPCLSVCTLDAANNNLCSGCFRTLDEIGAWSLMTDDEKRQVWTLIEQRMPSSPQ